MERALSIRTKKLGENHPGTVSSQNSLEIVRKKVRAQLGRLVVKRRAQPIARGHGTAENTPFRMAGVKTRSKKRPAMAVIANAMNKTGGKLPWANCVKCNWTSHTSSRPRRLWCRTKLAILDVGIDGPSMVLFRYSFCSQRLLCIVPDVRLLLRISFSYM